MNFIEFLKDNENTRKIFGQREIKIIEKQLNGINLTQSEKNRLSRDIRKKLQFIKEIENFKEQFGLKKGEEINKKIKETIRIILENNLRNKIDKIILFGSVAENKITIRSDIDIAVIFDELTKEEAFNFRKKILGQVPDNLDIQVFNFLPKKIQQEINKKGKILYIKEKNLKQPEYEKQVFDILFNNKIISQELSLKLQDAKGMRNIIAHEYGKVDDELIFHSLTEELIIDSYEFIKQIEKVIKKCL